MSKIQLQQVALEKQRPNGDKVMILNGIDLKVQNEEILCLIGPSGSGKSTIIRSINRLEEISSGEILLDGGNIFNLSPSLLRKRVGMVLQSPSLFDLSVRENIAYGPKLHDASEKEQAERAEAYLSTVGLEKDLLDRQALTLSIGQQQRVSIARTLANEPEVLLLDEITSALDPISTQVVETLILDIRKRLKKTIIIVTHSMDLAKHVGDRTALIAKGEVVELNDTASFFERPEHPLTQQFVSLDATTPNFR